jgi:hypothetical protein
MGCVVPQPFVGGGNWSYLDLWAVTGDPRYLGYKTLIIAPEPSVERAARAIHLTGCRICTHIILRVKP